LIAIVLVLGLEGQVLVNITGTVCELVIEQSESTVNIRYTVHYRKGHRKCDTNNRLVKPNVLSNRLTVSVGITMLSL